MKSFLIKWKTNGTITPPQTLVVGEDYRSAIINTFHHNCIDAVQTYEEVKPYFLNLRVNELPFSFPITLYYTKHGNGKTFLQHYTAVLNNEFIHKALLETKKEQHSHIGDICKSFFSKINSKYSSYEVE